MRTGEERGGRRGEGRERREEREGRRGEGGEGREERGREER